MPKITAAKNIHLYVQDWGAGKNIVFIHGWPFDQRMFEYQMMALAKRDCRVVAIDLRGFGLSDKPWDGNDYDTWSMDVGKAIAELILRDVTLTGFGMGAAVAANYVARRIDTRISKLALISVPALSAGLKTEDRKTLDEHMKDMLADRPKFMDDYVKGLMQTPAGPEYRNWLAAMGRNSSIRACVRGLEEMRDRDLRPALGNIRLPTRFFHGAMDQVNPIALAEAQVGMIKGATLVRFENSGNAIFWDEKDKLVDELEKFAGEKAARAAA